jgi:hypothetical protein
MTGDALNIAVSQWEIRLKLASAVHHMAAKTVASGRGSVVPRDAYRMIVGKIGAQI